MHVFRNRLFPVLACSLCSVEIKRILYRSEMRPRALAHMYPCLRTSEFQASACEDVTVASMPVEASGHGLAHASVCDRGCKDAPLCKKEKA